MIRTVSLKLLPNPDQANSLLETAACFVRACNAVVPFSTEYRCWNRVAQRRRLQSNGSRASKRKLRAISGRESRRVEHVNHEVSKAIVNEARLHNMKEIRLEDLTHIRDRIKAGKRMRSRLHRWAFRQLQEFISYKAEDAGISVVYVNPAYTSQTCSKCGMIGKRVKHGFSCLCGNRRHSDVNAAVNIASFAEPIGTARAEVNRPYFARSNLGM